jgi:hypothetical protein
LICAGVAALFNVPYMGVSRVENAFYEDSFLIENVVINFIDASTNTIFIIFITINIITMMMIIIISIIITTTIINSS